MSSRETSSREVKTEGQTETGADVPRAWCVRCRATQPMTNATITRTRNGQAALFGLCATCGTRMWRFGEWRGISVRTDSSAGDNGKSDTPPSHDA